MKDGTFEVDKDAARQGTPIALIGWGQHAIRMVGFNAPMPPKISELCIQGAHYSQAIKAQARACHAHALLYYGGQDQSPLEQYAALAAVAGVLSEHGALLVCNESARTSLPANVLGVAAFSAAAGTGGIWMMLRHFPLLMLYCGFVKYELEGTAGVWMRTYGCQMLGLPNLGFLAAGHHMGRETYEMFENLLGYIRDSGAEVAPGHTLQLGDKKLRTRSPTQHEPFLNDTPGEFLVLELAK